MGVLYALIKFILSYAGLSIIPAAIAGIVVLWILMILCEPFANFMQASAKFVLDNMPILFIPMFVSLFLGGKLPEKISLLLGLMFVSSLITLALTGLVIEMYLRWKASRNPANNERSAQ